jgi:hypothetical protein
MRIFFFSFSLFLCYTLTTAQNVCEGSYSLTVGESVTLSANATTDGVACTNATGVWLDLAPAGVGFVAEAVACSVSSLHVVQSCSTGDASCVATGVEQEEEDGEDCLRVTWETVENVVYSLFVEPSTTSTFSISLQQVEAPLNNRCTGAPALVTPVDGMIAMEGSTRNATLDRDDLACRIRYESAGVWYTVTGTGTILRASTCNNKTDFDSALSVFPAVADENCETALDFCAGGNQDNFDCGFVDGATLTWPSTTGQLYYILVHGNRPHDIGDFRLTMQQLETEPNNNCEMAIGPLPIDTLVTGSTVQSTPDPDLKALCAGSNFSPGVWFTVEGTGNILVVSTCAPETNFDTRVAIMKLPTDTSSCTDDESFFFECVAVHDDDLGCNENIQASTAEFNSTRGQLYYILMHGALENSVGGFGLTVTEKISADEATSSATLVWSSRMVMMLSVLLLVGWF